MHRGVMFATYGTTSACAENTYIRLYIHLPIWNYLRVRGEYCLYQLVRIFFLELPPRARRIPTRAWHGDADLGTTSACAENTALVKRILLLLRNYLRVRGEYAAFNSANESLMELPPRARRIRQGYSLGV